MAEADPLDERLKRAEAALHGGGLDKIKSFLHALSENPPQSLLLEGGSEDLRLAAALYWAMAANCPYARGKGRPCLSCPVCRRIAALEFSDLFVFDGRISNADDEADPGRVRSLRMDNIRALRVILGSQPNGDGKRIVIIQGMTSMREEAMNSLLKILEEPSKSTLFVLLTSQRERLLPTLASRSACLALPWTDIQSAPAPHQPLAHELGLFLQTGKSFLSQIRPKGALDQDSAAALLLECQKALARIISGKKRNGSLDSALARLDGNYEALSQASAWANEAHVLLQANVSPVRVMEAFATRMYCALHQT